MCGGKLRKKHRDGEIVPLVGVEPRTGPADHNPASPSSGLEQVRLKYVQKGSIGSETTPDLRTAEKYSENEQKVENPGIDPGASRMLSERSTI